MELNNNNESPIVFIQDYYTKLDKIFDSFLSRYFAGY